MVAPRLLISVALLSLASAVLAIPTNNNQHQPTAASSRQSTTTENNTPALEGGALAFAHPDHALAKLGALLYKRDWHDLASEACERVGMVYSPVDIIMHGRCTVGCGKPGMIPRFEKLADGTECEVIGFRRDPGACKDGFCVSGS
jgi:hypothetical protein